MGDVLSVKAVGKYLVQNFEALEGTVSIRRFVGRKHDPAAGGFVPTESGDVVPFRKEYRDAVRAGELEPMDEATAKLCDVPWNPK